MPAPVSRTVQRTQLGPRSPYRRSSARAAVPFDEQLPPASSPSVAVAAASTTAFATASCLRFHRRRRARRRSSWPPPISRANSCLRRSLSLLRQGEILPSAHRRAAIMPRGTVPAVREFDSHQDSRKDHVARCLRSTPGGIDRGPSNSYRLTITVTDREHFPSKHQTPRDRVSNGLYEIPLSDTERPLDETRKVARISGATCRRS